jgi:hypothetical protein
MAVDTAGSVYVTAGNQVVKVPAGLFAARPPQDAAK